MRRERGYILLSALTFMTIMLIVSVGLFNYSTQYYRFERNTVASAQAIALAEAGLEKAIYELNENPGYAGETLTQLGNGQFTTAITSIDSNNKRISATAYIPSSTNPIVTKTVRATVNIGTSIVSFQFGVQVGDGGITLDNSSTIRGNVYSNGPVVGALDNLIRGTVVSAASLGLIDDIHATGTVYAHTIRDSDIDGSAYYVSISNTSVDGTLHPNSPDQATSTLPISDATIEEWKTAAEAGGVINSPCAYTITTSVTIGPRKINCDLVISGSPTVTLAGPIWVNGNITIQNTARVRVASSLGGSSVAIIADKPSNPTSSGVITLQNSAIFEGSGTPGSYVLFVSQNTSAQSGGSNVAIDLKNSVDGDLLAYAGHGLVRIQNSIDVKEVSAWKLQAQNSAEVIYETGLANPNFTSGPGGSWEIVPGSYAITD